MRVRLCKLRWRRLPFTFRSCKHKLHSDFPEYALATAIDPQLHLLTRTPASARRVRYVGAGCDVFEALLAKRNPAARLVEDRPEALVLADFSALQKDPSPLEALAPGGAVTIVLPPGPVEAARAVLARLSELGVVHLRLLPARSGSGLFDDRAADLAGLGPLPPQATAEALVAVGRKGPCPEPLHLHKVAFAPRLMDIRTRLPAHALRSEASMVVSYRHAPFNSLPELPAETPKVLVLQRPAESRSEVWLRSMEECNRRGWLVVVEQDDHPQLIAETLAVPLSGFEWTRMGLVHAVQTSTPSLAAAFARFNPEVKIFSNALFELRPPPGPRPRRVFYGALSRGPLAAEVAGSLASTVARFPDLEFVVVHDRAVFDALPTRRKTFYEPMPYEGYLDLMASCAVSLTPLARGPHVEAKSDAKFLDAAACGAVTLGSASVYAESIRHGETGLIARRLEDWAPLLTEVLADEPFRRRMAEAAYAEVRSHRMFADQVAEREAWYSSLWERREALQAAFRRRAAEYKCAMA